MRKAALKAIEFYMRRISPLFPARCRYYPTCSQYTYEAVERYGFVIGSVLGAMRLLRCNPLWPGGVDPVPDLKWIDYIKTRKNHHDTPGGSR
jgi:uncharacterized protein